MQILVFRQAVFGLGSQAPIFDQAVANFYIGGIFINNQLAVPFASSALSFTQEIIPDPTPVSVTPEPSSLALLGTGILGIGSLLRRRITA